MRRTGDPKKSVLPPEGGGCERCKGGERQLHDSGGKANGLLIVLLKGYNRRNEFGSIFSARVQGGEVLGTLTNKMYVVLYIALSLRMVQYP